MRSLLCPLLKATVGTLIVIGFLRSAESASLSVDELLTAPVLAPFYSASVSPDGSLVYTVRDPRRALSGVDVRRAVRTNVGWQMSGTDIWLADPAGGVERRLTDGTSNNWAASWSPDGRRLVFHSDRIGLGSVGEARLWVWERETGEIRQLTDEPLAMTQAATGVIEWTPDGRYIVVRLLPEDLSPEMFTEQVLGKAPELVAAGGGVTASVFSFDPENVPAISEKGQINLDEFLADISLVDVSTGEVQRVARNQRVINSAMTVDGSKLAWAGYLGYERIGSQQILASISIYDLHTKQTRLLVPSFPADYPQVSAFSWSPAGDRIAYQSTGPEGALDDVQVVSIDDGVVRKIVDGVPLKGQLNGGVGGSVSWNEKGDALFFVRDSALWRVPMNGAPATRFAGSPQFELSPIEERPGRLWTIGKSEAVMFTRDVMTKRVGLARVDLRSGKISQIIEEDKRYGGRRTKPVVTPDRRAIVYIAEDATSAPQWWVFEVEGRRGARPLTRVGPQLRHSEQGRTGLIDWRSLDGHELRGAVIYPVGYREGERYPMIVQVYGGSAVSGSLNQFGMGGAPVDNLQLFATRGYVVLMADSHLRVGTPMQDLLKSVMPGVDRAVALGIADPDRVGLIGHSYGGYSTLSLIVQTQRFKAAVVSAGIGNLTAAYGALGSDGSNYLQSWAESGQGRMGGSPWEYRDRYIENSPMFYLDRVTTPLLIVQGASDTAPWLSDQMFSSLRRLGKRVEYARYAGEDHWPGTWSLANQRDYLTRVIDWFDRYLKSSPKDKQEAQ